MHRSVSDKMNVRARKTIFVLKSFGFAKMFSSANRGREDAYYVNLTADRCFKVFHHLPLSSPKPVGIVYVPGFRSTSQQGNVAQRLYKHCREKSYELVRYDPEGLGESAPLHDPQRLEFTHWIEDAESAMSKITSDKVVLVGSSLGGLMSIKLALKCPSRVSALFLMCPAISMTSMIEASWRQIHGKKSLQEVDPDEVFWFRDEPDLPGGDLPPLSFTRKLLETYTSETVKLNELTSPLNLHCPIVIIHGMEDDIAPYKISLSLVKNVRTPSVDLVLRKDGDHRLSREEDLQVMTDCLDRLINSL